MPLETLDAAVDAFPAGEAGVIPYGPHYSAKS
jgi:hypothetical protein